MSRDELSKTMLEAGFVDARYISLSTGFATVHFGLRPTDLAMKPDEQGR